MEIRKPTKEDEDAGWSWNFEDLKGLEREVEAVSYEVELETLDALMTILEKRGYTIRRMGESFES